MHVAPGAAWTQRWRPASGGLGVAPCPRSGVRASPRAATGVAASSVSDHLARPWVRNAAEQEGWELEECKAVDGECRLPRGTRLWVYDLAPWNDVALHLLRCVTTSHPAVPVLLFVPTRTDVASLLVRCGSAPCLTAEFQLRDREQVIRLRAAMRDLVRNAPGEVIGSTIVSLMPPDPNVARFCRQAVAHLCYSKDQGALTVYSVSHDLHVGVRTLERACGDASLPPPKEMLDWITLLVAAYTAAATQTRTCRVAAYLGVDSQKLWRLRHRLLAPAFLREPGTSVREFERVLLGFADRCGIARERANELAAHLVA